MSDTCRCFIAIDLSHDLKDQLAQLRSRLTVEQPEIHWAKPANWHITLKFLGDQKLKKIDQISSMLHHLRIPEEKIVIRLNQLGVFPDAKKPRILWAGFEDNAAILNIYDQIETQLGTIGIPKEKRAFVPHITIARIKTNLETDTLRLIEKYSRFNFPEKCVDRLTFYKSTLSAGGSLYEPLATIALKN